MPPKIPESTKQQVRSRAGLLCEYCHCSETWQLIEFTVDHVVPVSLGGTDDIDNLALACFHCNRRKSNKIAIPNRTAGSEILLFNPRKMSWPDHFIWSADLLRIEPLTDIGAATIEHLVLNRERIVQIRYLDLLVDRHPPVNDPSRSSKLRRN